MKKTQFKGAFMLFLAAFIWGTAFAAQSAGMDKVEAFTFNGIRMLLGSAFLIPFIFAKAYADRKKNIYAVENKKAENKKLILYGCILGVVLCIASNLQQLSFACKTASTGKVAFITAFYILFVPLLGLFMKKRVSAVTWLCVGLGLCGLYFLCVGKAGFAGIMQSDILAFACSVFFALHILLIEKFTAEADPLKLSCLQFFVTGVITCVLMFIFEKPNFSAVISCAGLIAYSGIMSCGLAFTLQTVGQKYAEATAATLILSFESVFGALSGAVILHEHLLPRELLGCVIMFCAVIVSQLGDKITSMLRNVSLKKNS